jgi:hypothetical protein
VKPGLGASRVSRDGRCSTIAGRAGQNETPGVILRGLVFGADSLHGRDEEPGQVADAELKEAADGFGDSTV